MNIDQELIKDIADQGEYLSDDLLNCIASRVAQDIERDFEAVEETTLTRLSKNEKFVTALVEDYVDNVRDEVIEEYEDESYNDNFDEESQEPFYDPWSYSPNYNTP